MYIENIFINPSAFVGLSKTCCALTNRLSKRVDNYFNSRETLSCFETGR